MRAFDMGSRLVRVAFRRDARGLFGCAMLLLWAGPASAAITTSGNVNPHPATTTTNDTLYIGQTAFGTMDIDGGSDVVSGTSYLGYEDAATGIVTVSGNGSTWTTRLFRIGDRGGGELTIADGATVNTNSIADIANVEFSEGVVTVTGANSQWNINSSLNIGDSGNGAMTIENGGHVSSSFGTIGGFDGVGTVTISGMGSRWTSTSSLTVADGNQGTLTISDGGLMSNRSATIAQLTDSVGSVTIDGTASRWTSTGDLTVGSSGMGTLNINGGLAEVSQDTFVGRSSARRWSNSLQQRHAHDRRTAGTLQRSRGHRDDQHARPGDRHRLALRPELTACERQFTLDSRTRSKHPGEFRGERGRLAGRRLPRSGITYDRRRRDGRVQEWLSRLSFRRNR